MKIGLLIFSIRFTSRYDTSYPVYFSTVNSFQYKLIISRHNNRTPTFLIDISFGFGFSYELNEHQSLHAILINWIVIVTVIFCLTQIYSFQNRYIHKLDVELIRACLTSITSLVVVFYNILMISFLNENWYWLTELVLCVDNVLNPERIVFKRK